MQKGARLAAPPSGGDQGGIVGRVTGVFYGGLMYVWTMMLALYAYMTRPKAVAAPTNKKTDGGGTSSTAKSR